MENPIPGNSPKDTSFLREILSPAKGTLGSVRFLLVMAAGVVLGLISVTIAVSLWRDKVTDGIAGLLGIATGFFVTLATLKWREKAQETSENSISPPQSPEP